MCRIRFSPMLMILKSIIDLLLAFPYPISIFPPECPTDLPDASQPACLPACLPLIQAISRQLRKYKG